MSSAGSTSSDGREDVAAAVEKLFDNAMKGAWDEVVETYKRWPKAREARLTKSEDTALHLAVRDGRSDIVERMVDIIFGDSRDREDVAAAAEKPLDGAMKGAWDEVMETYERRPKAREARPTRAEDTALLPAVRDGRSDIVERTVDIIFWDSQEDAIRILKMKNEGGNTPLHLAASLGNVEMCYCIAQQRDGSSHHVDLICARNQEGETPLFLAAHFGNKEAFLCLQSLCNGEDQGPNYTPCRKSNGDTILHSAISGEFFDLAFQIISYYPKLVNYVNENGLSPLHILAGKPSVFKSSCRLQLIDDIIYRCTFVDELKKESHNRKALSDSTGSKDETFPENYRVCMDFVKVLGVAFQVLSALAKESRATDEENPIRKSNVSQGGNQGRQDNLDRLFPSNYSTCIQFFKFVMKALLIILGFGFRRIKKIQEKKEKHTWAFQIMDELVQPASTYRYDYNGRRPMVRGGESIEFLTPSPLMDDCPMPPSTITSTRNSCLSASKHEDQNGGDLNGLNKRETPILLAAKIGLTDVVDKFLNIYPDAIQELNSARKNLLLLTYEAKKAQDFRKRETPLLVAAKMGITEMVEKILDKFPVAIQDVDSNKKNAVLLAVENRQSHIYNLLLQKKQKFNESVFRQVDDQGNSALHLASIFGEHQPWLIPGAALQMQWEIKWYKFVKHSMPSQFFVRYNKRGQNPREIFTYTHKDLVKSGSEWLTKTSESCSVVAALIATVAFATSATVPGGVRQETGVPTLEDQPAFVAFSISSLIALCFSVTSLVFFLAILTSRCQEKDFRKSLPTKLLLGLTSLFASIASMLVSFCAGHFFILREKLKYAAFPIYAVTCLPVTFFAFQQLPLYFDLIWAIIAKVPERSYKVFPH